MITLLTKEECSKYNYKYGKVNIIVSFNPYDEPYERNRLESISSIYNIYNIYIINTIDNRTLFFIKSRNFIDIHVAIYELKEDKLHLIKEDCWGEEWNSYENINKSIEEQIDILLNSK
jgi:hypothetical protein